MTFSEILTDVGAGVAAVAAIATVLAHLPFMPAKAAEFFARIALYASNAKFSVNQRDTMPPAPKAPTFGSMGPMGGMLALCLCLSMTGCAGWKPIVKDIDQAAIILCDVFFSEQPNAKGLSPADVEKAFCSTADQVAPFLDSAKKAAGRGGAIRLSKVPQ